ncbi:uncharacterized protein MYCFIDRAFT_79712 [Pseudocercospora fijiensis CIRAD86]|uniref:F-box domain-containing protein n=1 Tax=Pseudocercospora fijiensis (strain CIRAD86) TaxID=383855 RepID=M2ZJ97_PSEFD|nr:uncharacterized protein MYCFIDRAFT_79712 [Pseudocercospora fijiensis CIRAD86]EME79169.1 hypothetical protein MYCFIDRAFT_79712 [Pseudocercospora fijiensis CIRAD86]
MATFIGLPLEMKLDIFGCLPAKDVQCDGSLKDLADNFETHLHHPFLLQHHPLFGVCGTLAERLTDLHAYLYGPFDVKVDEWLFASRDNFVQRVNWAYFGVSGGWASEMYDILAYAPILQAEWRDQDQHVKAFEACLPLTTLKPHQFYRGRRVIESCAEARDRGRGVIAMSELVRVFDVPALPSEGHCAGIVAYCVKSKWARDSVENGQSLKPLEKAAVMEEIFLF